MEYCRIILPYALYGTFYIVPRRFPEMLVSPSFHQGWGPQISPQQMPSDPLGVLAMVVNMVAASTLLSSSDGFFSHWKPLCLYTCLMCLRIHTLSCPSLELTKSCTYTPLPWPLRWDNPKPMFCIGSQSCPMVVSPSYPKSSCAWLMSCTIYLEDDPRKRRQKNGEVKEEKAAGSPGLPLGGH